MKDQVDDKMKLVTEAYQRGSAVFQNGPVSNLEGFEFVLSESLAWWMHECPEVITTEKEWKDMGATGKFKPKPSYDVQPLLCHHGRISPGQTAHVKCVPERLVSSSSRSCIKIMYPVFTWEVLIMKNLLHTNLKQTVIIVSNLLCQTVYIIANEEL